MNAGVAWFIYGLVPEFLMRLSGLASDPYVLSRGQGRPGARSRRGSLHPRLQSRELCRRGGHRRLRAAAIRFVMDHRIFRLPLLSFLFGR